MNLLKKIIKIKKDKESKKPIKQKKKVGQVRIKKPEKEIKKDEKKDEQKEGKSQKNKNKIGSADAYKILLKPHQTEKATILASENKYVFQVSTRVNKLSIKQAFFDLYGIKPIAVDVINNLGKTVRYGRRQGRTKNWKKAVVTLPQGKTIKLYEGV